MSNAERFINAYAIIERKLSEIAGQTKYVPFSQLLSQCQSSQIVVMNQQALRQYNELRNAIVHQRGKENEIVAEPSDSVTADIERIAALLEKGDNIMRYVSSPVKTILPSASLKEVYEQMKQLTTAKVLVYEDNKYRGIITMEAVAAQAMDDRDADVKAKDMIERGKDKRVLFLGKKAGVSDAVKGFEDAMKQGYNLLAVIVSENGYPEEEPLGIITTSDMPKILTALL